VSERTRRRALGAAAVGCLALQFPGRLWLSAAALGAFLLALAALDRRPLARLWRPRFLVGSAAIALGAGLLLGPCDAAVLGLGVSTRGLLAGVLMVVRGLLIFALTTWAAGLLAARRPARRRGALGAAVAAAVRLVPDLTERLRASVSAHAAAGRGRWAAARAVGADLLFHAACLAEELAAAPPDEP
jgi:hypothetical protein